jgi:glycerophosphoryl diester phosphodiesterase
MKTLSLISFAFCLSAMVMAQPNPIPKPRHQFIVVAHRGDHTQYPENTIEAYQQAIKDGADYIEIDVRATSDGQLISLHDASVNRMTDGKGLIKELTIRQIQNLKIRSKNQTDTVTYRIPTFEQVLKLCQNKICIYIDFKDADAAPTYVLLKKYHMEKQALVYINKPSQVPDWRAIYPAMPLMVSLPDSAKTVAAMQQFINLYHPDILDGNYTGYTAEMLAYAQTINLPVWPDAQSATEGPLAWGKAVAMGFKGLQTDNPPALIKYLEQKGLR